MCVCVCVCVCVYVCVLGVYIYIYVCVCVCVCFICAQDLWRLLDLAFVQQPFAMLKPKATIVVAKQDLR